MQKTWLITGSTGGLGRHIAEAALKAGHNVVGTARRPEALKDLADQYGDRFLAVPLDVTNEDQSQAAVQAAVETFGSLDVLVNNAGFADLRPFEQAPSDDFRAVVETCLFGVVNLTRAALPVMRQQRSGHIIQISSIGGRVAFPGSASYHAAKWGVGGFTDAVAQEVAPLGIVMTTLEPGGMRTGFGDVAGQQHEIWPDYQPTVGAALEQMKPVWGNESGDPVRIADLILKLAEAQSLPPHIVLGKDALGVLNRVEEARATDTERWAEVTTSIGFDADGPLPDLP